MRIAVTGGTGFIGSHLLPRLVLEGHQIGLFTRFPEKSKSQGIGQALSLLKTDTYEDILDSISSFRPDVVIHLATLYLNKHTVDDIAPLIQSNILFGTYLLEAMRTCKVKKILNFGTRWQHLSGIRSNSANLYAATKSAFHEILDYYARTESVTYTTLELCDTFGRNDTRKKVVQILVDACKNRTVVELSPGEQVLDLICIDDLVEYIIGCLDTDSVFLNNVQALSGEEIMLKDLGDMIEKIFSTYGYLNWGAKPYREREIMNPPVYHEIVKIQKHSLEYHLKKQFLLNEGV